MSQSKCQPMLPLYQLGTSSHTSGSVGVNLSVGVQLSE